MAKGLRLLVKASGALAQPSISLGLNKPEYVSTPLFTSIGRSKGLAAAAVPEWRIVAPCDAADPGNPWQACHAFLDAAAAVGAPAEFAEPDLEQQWLTPREDLHGLSLAGNCDTAAQQNPSYPRDRDNDLWFRDAVHGQYDSALSETPDPGPGKRVRIAHLDTGYDPAHKSLPLFLNTSLQRNFVDDDRPKDASDDSSGFFNNIGHGTGTLSILAGASVAKGRPMGVAPFAEVVPVRVANRVVLFSNSAVAQAFDYVHGLCAVYDTRIHVITMSMGGVASQAWVEAINALYDAGVFVVAAAGNNYANLPVRQIVYPARFNRVVAACGVMQDGKPYADLSPALMAGNYGPPDKMATAIAAYTPNTPWARFGCSAIVDGNGNGTSAATPQVAATAALWIQKNRKAYDAYSAPWMRVEAVRKSLFESARFDPDLRDHFGRGRLAAKDALHTVAAQETALVMQAQDSAPFPLLKLLTGVGLEAVPKGRQAMLELEALQAVQTTGLPADLLTAMESGVPSIRVAAQIADALLAKPGLSDALRATLGGTNRQSGPRSPVPVPLPPTSVATPAKPIQRPIDPVGVLHLSLALAPPVAPPAVRRLRVFTFDPARSLDLDTAAANVATVAVRWEAGLQPGPVGEYLEVVDVDPASGCCYAPVDLNHPFLIAQNGLAPSEANPQFHQQMVYAVAMRTIDFFEKALGRAALRASRYVRNDDGDVTGEFYVRRLRIYPHAIRMANSFYSSDRKALLLGYFNARQGDAGTSLPGGRIFCATSHDIVAHETSHALLDGLHRRYQEATNPDVLAFHEAFADIVALFQHFTIPEALIGQILKTRGDLESESLLGQLAVEFGQATKGGYAALRSALGFSNSDGKWQRAKPSRSDYDPSKDPHDLGAVLVSAVFAAFSNIYRMRSADLIRLATGGAGVLPEGAISYDLAGRLAAEASKLAAHILAICIRALDYCPPVDLTFGDYLRALITADRDLVPDDTRGYRIAFISAFRDRGIYPSNVQALSVDSATWEPPPLPLTNFEALVKQLDLDWTLETDREAAFNRSRDNACKVHRWLMDPVQAAELDALGFVAVNGKPVTTTYTKPTGEEMVTGELQGIEVHSVRPAHRTGPDGQSRSSLIIEITQTLRVGVAHQRIRCGCTLVIGLDAARTTYFVRKKMLSVIASAAARALSLQPGVEMSLRANYFGSDTPPREPFALLHRHN